MDISPHRKLLEYAIGRLGRNLVAMRLRVPESVIDRVLLDREQLGPDKSEALAQLVTDLMNLRRSR
jgi:hypothetical protein